jgi:hypothetical protein
MNDKWLWIVLTISQAFFLSPCVLVAMTQELAEERRHKRGINSSAGANKRSSSTPGILSMIFCYISTVALKCDIKLTGNYSFVILDGSVLKNDVKQQLAKERREQQKRQQEGTHVQLIFF